MKKTYRDLEDKQFWEKETESVKRTILLFAKGDASRLRSKRAKHALHSVRKEIESMAHMNFRESKFEFFVRKYIIRTYEMYYQSRNMSSHGRKNYTAK